MARTRGAATNRTGNVLQDITNTRAQSRPTRGKAKGAKALKHDEIDTSAPTRASNKKHGSARQFAVAKTLSRASRTKRAPLQSTSHNARSTNIETTKGHGLVTKGRSRSSSTSTSPTSPSSTAPTQPLVASSLRASQRTRPSRSAVTGTPSAIEQSMLVLKSFKRRPRQPSMLNMVKRRLESARSSVAGDAVLLSSDDESLDLDNFLPDAAGTPLHSSGLASGGPSGNKRKRASTSATNTVHKLRKLVSQSDHEDADQASELSTPNVRISVTPELLSHDSASKLNITELAAGSSPVYESSEQASPGSVVRPSQLSVYGPPVSQITPPRDTRASRQLVAPTSAILQSLLPKRRKQLSSTHSVPRFSAVPTQEDDDARHSEERSDSEEEHSEFVRVGRNARKGTKPAARLSKPSTRNVRSKIAKTYARKLNEETDEHADEHHDEHGATKALIDVAHNEELAAAKKRFAAIDEWELEYETLTTEDSRNSSQGWR